MTNWEYYFGTPEKAARMTVVDTGVRWVDGDHRLSVVVKTIHCNGDFVVTISDDDYYEWLKEEYNGT